MSRIPGGSAWAMVRDIAEGYQLVTARSFRGMGPGDLNQLAHELDRQLREVRGSQVPLDDHQAVQQRNRRIQRLNHALLVLRSFRQNRR